MWTICTLPYRRFGPLIYTYRRLHSNLTALYSKSSNPNSGWYLCVPTTANYLQFIFIRNLLLIRKRRIIFLRSKNCVFCIIYCALGVQYWTKQNSREHCVFFRGTREHFEILKGKREHRPPPPPPPPTTLLNHGTAVTDFQTF